MTLLKGKIAESTLLRIPMGKYDGLTVRLWSSTQSVQVGSVGQIETDSWECFVDFRLGKREFKLWKTGISPSFIEKNKCGRLLVLV